MEKPKKKSFWKVLGRVTLFEIVFFINMYIIDWIRKVEFSWSELGTRLIAMVFVILLMSFLAYKFGKE